MMVMVEHMQDREGDGVIRPVSGLPGIITIVGCRLELRPLQLGLRRCGSAGDVKGLILKVIVGTLFGVRVVYDYGCGRLRLLA